MYFSMYVCVYVCMIVCMIICMIVCMCVCLYVFVVLIMGMTPALFLRSHCAAFAMSLSTCPRLHSMYMILHKMYLVMCRDWVVNKP